MEAEKQVSSEVDEHLQERVEDEVYERLVDVDRRIDEVREGV